ncbi:MAG: hypothetical protein Q8M31_01360 [Beijerinckiaceae bacterium]|nr:hypothetical protein [Beijerinckiaceae bacterium]
MADKEKKADKADNIRKETDVKGDRPARREKDVVTEASEDSFPASDPPSYMAGSAIAGSPPKRRSDDEDDAEDDAKHDTDKKKAS